LDERVKRILEYDKILTQIAAYATSEAGAARCLALLPQFVREGACRALAETVCTDEVWTRIGGNPMQPFEDCRELFDRCAVGGVPAAGELLAAARTLRAIRLVKAKLAEGECGEPLSALADALYPEPAVEREIFRCILGEDEISDDASPALRDIRRQIRLATERVRQKLNEIIASTSMRAMLQDAIVTLRHGRYVVPVKAEYASAMGGLEHDRSASGATVFIEPLAVLQANNALREHQAAERAEIARILAALGQLLGACRERAHISIDAMAEFDMIFAKVGWGRAHKGVPPRMVEAGELVLKGARHPLIPNEQVVPIDIMLGGETRALIITGPNTGGKTVTLKTVGLFVLLAQSGVFLPCARADAPFYRAIYADIGDEQSIEQSLSTFSSHMRNLVDIVKNAAPQTLVLADELGVGTDPAEGAALAIAMLKSFVQSGADVIATTHYSELKSFAMTEPGFVNAGMEFDLNTLRPTYRVLIGFAGSSNAFEISRRLGLPDEVINSAKEHMSEEATRLEDAIRAAENLRALAQRQLQRAHDEADEQREALERELETLRQTAQKDQQRAQQALVKARQTLDAARAQADEAVEAARSAASEQNRAERERLLHDARASQRTLSALSAQLEQTLAPNNDERPAPKHVRAGDAVYVQSLRADAIVLSPPDAKGEVLVQAGIMKVSVPMNQLRVAAAPPRQASSARVRREIKSVPMEVDVRGLTVDEATAVIDMHIDAAVLNGMEQTCIIHGKGTGALRAGVRAHLSRHPHVNAQRSGGYGEGDEGVTIVELR
jgi:DNA mismatch repair protein MutS2